MQRLQKATFWNMIDMSYIRKSHPGTNGIGISSCDLLVLLGELLIRLHSIGSSKNHACQSHTEEQADNQKFQTYAHNQMSFCAPCCEIRTCSGQWRALLS